MQSVPYRALGRLVIGSRIGEREALVEIGQIKISVRLGHVPHEGIFGLDKVNVWAR